MDIKLKVQRVTNYFENGDFIFHFDYWEKLGDGRGITAGFCGFTQDDDSGDSDLKEVYNQYIYISKDNVRWTDFIIKSNWQSLAKNSHNLRQAQLDICDREYWAPAIKHIQPWMVNIFYLLYYDMGVQHGWGNDPDSANAIINRVGIPDKSKEGLYWIKKLCEERRKVLTNPVNKETVRVWKESLPRVDAIEWIASHDCTMNNPHGYEKYIQDNV